MVRRIVGLTAALGLGLSLPSNAQTAASPRSEVMAVVRQFVDAFNKGDVNAMSAKCANEVAIIDEFPPHEWHGAGACAQWAHAFDTDAKQNGITDPVVTLGKPTHVDVTGDQAYVVEPADYAYKAKGKPVKEVGSIITLALHREATGWRITGWAWAKH